MKSDDTYKTIAAPGKEILYKDRNSKFYSYAFPLSEEENIKPIIESLRKKHPSAGHFCFACQWGTTTLMHRTNDDGEPNNSAGMPIYGQIQSHRLTNVLVVVVRYFGGTKLGVGGLISAYKTAAQMALENAEIIEKTIDLNFLITFNYQNINKVMRVIKEKNLPILSQKMENACEMKIAIRKSKAAEIQAVFESLRDVQVKTLE